MKKSLTIIAVLLLFGSLLFQPLTRAQPISDEQVDAMAEDTARGLADELVFENIASLAGSSCGLYGLGVDLLNIAYDGQWSFIDSLLEITSLFRNEPWRELIWAISDQREAFIEQMVELRKQRCLLSFAGPEAVMDNQQQQLVQQQLAVDKQIAELQAKIDYFGVQRRNMLFDQPHFGDFRRFSEDRFTLPLLATDKIFYPLGGFTALEVNWDHFLNVSKEAVLNAREDLTVVATRIPEDCFAVVTVGHELDAYFAANFRYQNGVYVNERGQEYASFQAFVRDNGAAIVQQYIDSYCGASRDRALAEAAETSAEQQLQELLDSLHALLEILGERLAAVESEITVIERAVNDGTATPAQIATVQQLYPRRAQLLAMIDYHSLVLNKVGSAESQSLEDLADSLASFAEAVLGVVKDDEGRKKSRLSFAERFENANERSLQKICARIESMYREAGRSTADLPYIGYAKGRRYCKATTECEGVDLTNFLGGSEGRQRLAECSGFTFDSSELGHNQATEDVLAVTSEDIGLLLEESALNELLQARNLHFSSLRGRYDALYGAQTDTTVILEQILEDVSLNLVNPDMPEIYNPDSNQVKTHYALMRKVYDDFYTFLDEQEGSCPAPEDPEQ